MNHNSYRVPATEDRSVLLVGGAHPGTIGWSTARELRAKGMVVYTPPREQLDVTSVHKLDKWFANRNSPVEDTLVLAHGATAMAPFADTEQNDVLRVLNVNLLGTINAMQAFVRATRTTPYRKHIVVLSSLGGSGVFTNSSVYCASKAAVNHLVRCAAWELTKEGYDIFTVSPGNVVGTNMADYVTEGIARVEGTDKVSAGHKFNNHITRGGVIDPEEVAEQVAWLVSGHASWLSGTDVQMTGGAR